MKKVKCNRCYHLTHRYLILFDGGYPELEKFLCETLDRLDKSNITDAMERSLMLAKTIMCDGVGCQFTEGSFTPESLEIEHECPHFKLETINHRRTLFWHSEEAWKDICKGQKENSYTH